MLHSLVNAWVFLHRYNLYSLIIYHGHINTKTSDFAFASPTSSIGLTIRGFFFFLVESIRELYGYLARGNKKQENGYLLTFAHDYFH